MALPPQQFCVRWNSYHTNLQNVFPRLLLTEQFCDVTLACDSKQLRCHKLVLSACSGYLEHLLLSNPCQHPIVLIKDMRFSEMQALVDFMYKGEVNVTQEQLPSLLKSAEALQIRGLCSGEPCEGKPADCKDFTVASDALVAHANHQINGASPPPPKKRKSPELPPAPPTQDVKQETVEEDGLYYGELDQDEYQEDEDSVKAGSSLGQTSAIPSYLRVKPESELYFQTKLQNLMKNREYYQKLSKLGSKVQNEYQSYNYNDESIKKAFPTDNDYYKSWLEQNGELEVSLLRASDKLKKQKPEPKSSRSEVELIPKTKTENAKIPVKIDTPVKRRGRPPIFKDKNLDIGDTVLKSDLDQFLEGKEISSSGLSRKDLERVMMGKFNPNRRYSNEAMWAALMDVKKGGSIYRAAQTHKVPRKSLRNWMKRCHIKSSFPMPQQLKQFVENSKKQKEFKNFEFQTTDTVTEPKSTDIDYDQDFGNHFLSYTGSNIVSSEDEIVANVDESVAIPDKPEDVEIADNTALNMSIHE